MGKSSFANQIRKCIERANTGTVFVSVDFADIAEKSRVDVIFSRLEEEKIICRVMHGVYYKAEYSAFLQENVMPLPDNVARALARNFGWAIAPCGDTALNLLGLSTQIPAVWVYVSDGTYKEYTYDHITIKFKRTTNKEISKLSYKSALVVQALKALGKENITELILDKLGNSLTGKEKEALLSEAKAVKSWIYETIKRICRS